MSLIETIDLKKKFGDLEVLRGISVKIEQGEVVAVIGPSGSGKSTFLRCLDLLDEPTGGAILFEGQDITRPGCDVNALRRKVGMVFQHFNLFPHMTVRQNITLVPLELGLMDQKTADARALELLTKVGLADKIDEWPDRLSGGQKQRVAIARSLAMEPSAILFDEPTSALDPEMIGEVLSVMHELAQGGMTMIVVTHEMGFAREAASRVLFIHEGRIICDTPPDQFFKDPGHPRASEFLSKIIH